MKPNELISIASNNIGDGGFVYMLHEEYMQFVNDTAYDLWKGSKALHTVREYLLPVDELYYDIPDDDIIQFITLQIRIKPAPTPITDPEPGIYDLDVDVTTQREKNIQQNIEEGLSIFQNVGETNYKHFLTPEFRNGRFRIQSPLKFTTNNVLTAYCVINSPLLYYPINDDYDDPLNSQLTAPNDADRIWESFRNLFIEGVTWRAARRAYNFTKQQNHLRIWNESEQIYYKRHLPDAIHYIHSIKTSTSALHVQPFKYLLDY